MSEKLYARISNLESDAQRLRVMHGVETALRLSAEARVVELEQKLADAWQTIEDVATGAGITCVKCNRTLPCTCGQEK
jgi:NOL1/NOP2/fmu family ribosome biogenesis protein